MAERAISLVIDADDNAEAIREKVQDLAERIASVPASNAPVTLVLTADEPPPRISPEALLSPQPRPARRGPMLGVLAAAAMMGADFGRGPSRTVTFRPEPKKGNAQIDDRRRERAETKRKRKAQQRLATGAQRHEG